MGGPVFDRQVFVKKQQAQRPPSRSPLPGGLVLLLVAALSAFATYRYVKAGGKQPSDPADKAQIAQLQTKLKATQNRLHELERRRHTAAPRHVTKESKPSDAKPTPAVSPSAKAQAADAPHHDSPQKPEPELSAKADAKVPAHSPTVASSSAPAPPAKAASPRTGSPTPANQAALSNKELSSLKGRVAATHDEWLATTDRLGNVVGQLDSQRSAIQQTQNGVNYLLERVQRSDVSFSLRKGSGLQHVGPIEMELESTSVKGQHYNIRMIVDDKSVVLKDRALNEIVQFYTSRSKYPLRLIISQIGRGEVSGTLAVPTGLSNEMNDTHLRQR